MSPSSLTNLPVALVVSDPWEFGTECGTGPFLGTVADASADLLVIRLASPITYRGRRLFGAIARPRHVGEQATSVAFKPLLANLLLIPAALAAVAEVTPVATKDGVPVIGTVERR